MEKTIISLVNNFATDLIYSLLIDEDRHVLLSKWVNGKNILIAKERSHYKLDIFCYYSVTIRIIYNFVTVL